MLIVTLLPHHSVRDEVERALEDEVRPKENGEKGPPSLPASTPVALLPISTPSQRTSVLEQGLHSCCCSSSSICNARLAAVLLCAC
jgi:hypothetical protein